MKPFLGLALVLAVALPLAGCQGGAMEGGDVPQDVQDAYANLGKAARDAGGNFDQLSQADKDAFIKRAGSESEARKMVSLMGGAGRMTPGGRPAGQPGVPIGGKQ